MDKISSTKRSANMRAIRSKETVPEMSVRKMAHSLGFRFRLHQKNLPGKPDLVFASKKKIIFVHGCFWHQHKAKNCSLSHRPKSNTDYWLPKLERNVERDKKNKRDLSKLGWKTLTVWECETKHEDKLKKKLIRFLEN